MLSHQDLAPLRLRDLLPADAEIVEHDGWEWMGHSWWYEGIGFTWFGRLEREPLKTAAFELSLSELSVEQLASLARALALPIRHGMPLTELVGLFGDPIDHQKFVSDRDSYDFLVSTGGPYRLSATIHKEGGLIHLSAILATLA